jgi:hypothetical protein
MEFTESWEAEIGPIVWSFQALSRSLQSFEKPSENLGDRWDDMGDPWEGLDGACNLLSSQASLGPPRTE